MEDLLENDLFHLVFAILAAIFLVGALVNAIRSRIRSNRRETASMIKNNGNTGNEHAPVMLKNPFAALGTSTPNPQPSTPNPAPAPVPASATVAAADNPSVQSVKASAEDDEEYVWR